MNCKEIKEILLTDYIDDEADEALRQQIEEHLCRCSDCRAVLEAATAVVRPLRMAESTPPPAALWQDVRNELEAERDTYGYSSIVRSLSFFPRRWLNAAAVISMLAFVSLAGNYCARTILSKQQVTARETVSTLGLDVLNDLPNEHVATVYRNLTGG
jgi:predicted anti-sigma-YlaC factor YlaD